MFVSPWADLFLHNTFEHCKGQTALETDHLESILRHGEKIWDLGRTLGLMLPGLVAPSVPHAAGYRVRTDPTLVQPHTTLEGTLQLSLVIQPQPGSAEIVTYLPVNLG